MTEADLERGAYGVGTGDPITAFLFGVPRHGKVIEVRGGDRYGEGAIPQLVWIPIQPPVRRGDCMVLVQSEHLTWLRGWPDLDSEEVKALQVARALR